MAYLSAFDPLKLGKMQGKIQMVDAILVLKKHLNSYKIENGKLAEIKPEKE